MGMFELLVFCAAAGVSGAAALFVPYKVSLPIALASYVACRWANKKHRILVSEKKGDETYNVVDAVASGVSFGGVVGACTAFLALRLYHLVYDISHAA